MPQPNVPKPQRTTLLHKWLTMFLRLFKQSIAKNREIAENCEKLRTATPTPLPLPTYQHHQAPPPLPPPRQPPRSGTGGAGARRTPQRDTRSCPTGTGPRSRRSTATPGHGSPRRAAPSSPGGPSATPSAPAIHSDTPADGRGTCRGSGPPALMARRGGGGSQARMLGGHTPSPGRHLRGGGGMAQCLGI